MAVDERDVDRLQAAVRQSIREHWVLFLVEGLVLLALGIAAILVPPLASLAVALTLGWLFLLSGLVGLATTLWLRQAPGFWWSLLSAALAIAAGVVLLAWPASSVISLTLVLVVFFLIEGIATIMFAIEHGRELSGRWGWMLASGIIDLILAVIIMAGLPGTAAWAIGLIVGINMTFGGIALITMALHARNVDPTSIAPAS